MAGLYIHIPFCASRCIYCGFYSTTMGQEQDSYISAVCQEMAMRSSEIADGLSTVYLGGGTPSLLREDNLLEIFRAIEDHFHPLWRTMEVTMECNPDDITEAFCSTLRRTPVNRMSMGAQTFSDSRLRFLRRRHTASEVPMAVERLRKAGIGNISIDLMFGFPGETLGEWRDDIDKAIALHPEHLSAYSLQYEEGTPLYRMLQAGRVSEIDDELYRQMYSLLCDKLTAAGYEHYEISNFALPGRRSRHNSSYWHNVPYIGIGASAHSYSGSTRSWNVSDLRGYVKAIGEGRRPMEMERIDARTHYDDLVMTALRTCEGIDLGLLSPRFRQYITLTARPYVRNGMMTCDGTHLALTRSGIFVSDMIMSDLMMPDEPE